MVVTETTMLARMDTMYAMPAGEQPTFDAGQGKQRHEHQHHDDGWHRRPDTTSVAAAITVRGRGGCPPVQAVLLLEAAQHVSTSTTASLTSSPMAIASPQRHGVDGQAEVAEYQRGDRQRPAEWPSEISVVRTLSRNKNSTTATRMGAIALGLPRRCHRMRNEIPEQGTAAFFDALGRALFQPAMACSTARQRHAVGARLLLHRQNHRRLAVVAGIAAFDRRRQNVGHLVQQDRLPVF